GDEQVGGDLLVDPGEQGRLGAVDEAGRLDQQGGGGGQGGDDQPGAARRADQVVGGQPALQAEDVADQRLEDAGQQRGGQRRRHQRADQDADDAAVGPRRRGQDGPQQDEGHPAAQQQHDQPDV